MLSRVQSTCLAAGAILLLSGTIGPAQVKAAQDGIQLAQNDRRDSNRGGESRSSSGRETKMDRSSSREMSAGRSSNRELSSSRSSSRALRADRSSRHEISGSSRSRVSVSSQPRRERISSRTTTRTVVRHDRDRDHRWSWRHHHGSRSYAAVDFVILGPRVAYRTYGAGWCRGLHRGRHWDRRAGWHAGRHYGPFRC
jgi:hypothetical protein